MNSGRAGPHVAIVSGDVTMDWNLARIRKLDHGALEWNADDCTRSNWQRGGAALLADLIGAVAQQLNESRLARWEVRTLATPAQPVSPTDAGYHHSYALWSAHKHDLRSSDKNKSAWRVAEFLGLNRCQVDRSPGPSGWKRVLNDTGDADLLVLDDAGLGFRDEPELWPQALTERQANPWILLKMSRPIARGHLWERLHSDFGSRLVVVMTVNDLRRTEVQISRELSWERTVQDLAWDLIHNPQVNALSRCAYVVISFGLAGAFLICQAREPEATVTGALAPKCTLFFDPKVIEGMWEQNHPGGMIGCTTCLAAAIARQLMVSPEQPNIAQGIQSGLAAGRQLHREGYADTGSKLMPRLAFPTELVLAESAKGEAAFAVADLPNPPRFAASKEARSDDISRASFWTILQDRYSSNLHEVARQVVLHGVDVALQGVPLGQFGGLLTVDRQEIESVRNIRALVGEYVRQGSQNRPLSVAVFGAPGSGKSFAITQVAESLLPGQIKKLEFNLSQFQQPAELLDALHQVRDAALSGLIPLVFWDEFDAPLEGQRLGWLPHFLAPMQDGKFQQGQIAHFIGRSIFVFAGGIAESMEGFSRTLKDDEFRALKGPDFVSRLKGYVHILGPNRQKPVGEDISGGSRFIIRRAILLRSILDRNARHIFSNESGHPVPNIDSGVLRAFLHTREYKHGARSMEAIVAMSLLAGRTRFERSCLPPEAQLDLHVDGLDFLALVEQIELEGELLERLAAVAHQVYCENRTREGWIYGQEKNESKKTSPLLVPYENLPEIYMDSNRRTVRSIPEKLARVGYIMIPSRSNEVPAAFPVDVLETMAGSEHDSWIQEKLALGFTLGKPTAEDPRRNENILPWDELPESVKQIDRDLIKCIPEILARAGYTIVKTRETAQAEPAAVSPDEIAR